MPFDAVLNIAFYRGLRFCWQAHTVKTPQVLLVGLPGMDVVCVFWKEAQEMLVPQHRPVLRVKNAQTISSCSLRCNLIIFTKLSERHRNASLILLIKFYFNKVLS